MSDPASDGADSLRLFVALALDEDVRRSVADALASLRDAERAVAWVPSANLHLTLRFLGTQPRTLVEDLRQPLERAAATLPPMSLVLTELGAFPALGRARVLWLGVEANVALAALYKKVDDACASLGLGREARDFHPHVTLGRVRPRARPSPTVVRQAADRLHSTWTTSVTTVDLMASRLLPGGSRHDRLVAAPLRGGAR